MPRSDGILANRLSSLLLVSAVALLFVGVVVGAVASGAVVSGQGSGPAIGDDGSTQIDPAELDTERDLSAFERQLANRIQQQVESGAVNLSDGQYDQVRDRLDSSEYEALLESYQSVAEENGNQGRAQKLTLLQQSMANYTRQSNRYRAAYRSYRLFRSEFPLSPDTDGKARTNARYLERLQTRVNTSGKRVLARIASLEGGPGMDLAGSATSIESSMRNISATQAEVRDAEFDRTTLRVDASAENVSFVDPLDLSGTLRTANGSAITNRSIHLRIGTQTIETRTDGGGRFTVTYRPVTLPRSTDTLTVRYLPQDTCPYLASEATLNVTVSPVEAAISVSNATTRVRYNDTLRVEGVVSAEQVGAPNVTLDVSAGGYPLGSVNTTENGSYVFAEPLPAAVPSGERTVVVEYSANETALRRTNASTQIQVAARETMLTIATDGTDDRLVDVTGRLELASGQGIPNRTVSLSTDGERLTTVTTGRNGVIDTAVVIPEDAVAEGNVSLVARFQGSGTNLQPSEAETTAHPTTAWLPSWLVPVSGVFLVVLLVTGGAIAWRRRSRPTVPAEGPIESAETAVDSGRDARGNIDPEVLLTAARERLEAGDPEQAIRLAYGATRASVDGPPHGTHWEFYRACAADGYADETVSRLQEITESYERATYATEGVSIADGERTVAAAASMAAE